VRSDIICRHMVPNSHCLDLSAKSSLNVLNEGTAMVNTHGLSHVALSVVDLDRSLAFYCSVFGVREYFRNESTGVV
jgi:catechol-2,3-dioxygenase